MRTMGVLIPFPNKILRYEGRNETQVYESNWIIRIAFMMIIVWKIFSYFVPIVTHSKHEKIVKPPEYANR